MNNIFLACVVVFFFLITGLSTTALAINVYVDTKTKQLYTEPGPGRERVGTLKIDAPSDEIMPEINDADERPIEKVVPKVSVDQLPAESNVRIRQGPDGVFRFETEDGDFSFRLGGRIHADASLSDGDHFLDSSGNTIEANDGTEIRRGRMKFEGTIFKDWFLKSEVNFADDKVAIKDMFMQYYGLGFARLKFPIFSYATIRNNALMNEFCGGFPGLGQKLTKSLSSAA